MSTPPLQPDILLIDVSGLVYAAMYTPQGRLQSNGFPTGGIYGALSSIFSRMAQRPGAMPLILWDSKATWRHELLPAYKASRSADAEKQAIREAVRVQMPILQLFTLLLGIPQLACGEAEADDLCGAICRHIDPSWLVEMVSRDTDWWQALARHIAWFSPVHGKQMTLADLANPENGFKDGHFLSTWEYLQAKALAGDDSDEIPGIEKVGLKTACKIMREHGGSIEEFWARVDAGTVKPKGVVIERVANAESREVYRRNIRLMDWREAPGLDLACLALSASKPDWAAAKSMADEFGLSKSLASARTALAPWAQGWGSALSAVDAALHHQMCLPVLNPSRPHEPEDAPEPAEAEEALA